MGKEELVTQTQIPRSQFEIVLSDLRGAQGTIYYDLECRGLNPYALDQITKIKSMVLMGVVGTHNALSVDDLTQLLKLAVEPAFDPSTREKVIGALHFAFQGVGLDKFDTAAALAAAILTGQQPQQAIDRPTMPVPAMSAPPLQQSQAGEGRIIGVTFDSQGFTDFLIQLLTACLELFRTSSNPQRRNMAMLLYNSVEKLQQVNLVQQKSVEILLMANEAMAWAVA